MDISKFIKNNNSKYDDELEMKIGKVGKLVEKNIISIEFGAFLMEFLIKKEVGDTVKNNIESIL